MDKTVHAIEAAHRALEQHPGDRLACARARGVVKGASQGT